jgi:outer membrane protein OmpA-like peptidoglycan-associated protein
MGNKTMMPKPSHVVYSLAYLGVLLLASCSSTKELVVLLPEEGGKMSALTVTDKNHTLTLDTPLSAARVNARGYAGKHAVTEAEVKKTFGPVLRVELPEEARFTLYFNEDHTDISPESQPMLEALLQEISRRKKAVEVQITGHTDMVGDQAYNDRLSMERAQTVRDILVRHGLRASFVRIVGRGEREPRIMTPDGQPEPRNRRVEVIVR